jgi:beta-glucanase (GH16 family)
MKKTFLRRVLPFALSFAMTLNASAFTNVARAEENGNEDDGYSLVWSEEFDGESLNNDDWNVEEHEPGWVNAELQRYTSLDEGNIDVSDGTLKIKPHVTEAETGEEENEEVEEKDISEVEKTDVSFDISVPEGKETTSAAIQINFGKIDDTEAGSAPATVLVSDLALRDVTEGEDSEAELLKSAAFENNWDWSFGSNAPGEGSIEYYSGYAVVTVKKAGDANWNVQLQQGDIELKAGHTYRFSMKSAATADRMVELSMLDPMNGYYWYGGTKALIPGADLDLGTGSPSTQKEREITSGRITTQGKHDFTYGRFETRAKVPYGKGYLPAFWLMATNESYYGQWPKCGEIDIMEVMGQNVNKSYHTVHYGYDSGSGHRQNQGTKTVSDTSFADDFHVFALEWDPGLITWYVDGEKVYETRDWYTGSDDNSQITYPAPFDQDFYVILNLAVGGSWVGYPDDSVYEVMNDQNFEVDYVRVYQKSPEEYQRLEDEVKKPESQDKKYREADETGNYVVNGDFSQDITYEGAEGDVTDNFKLHLESDAEGSDFVINNGEITINPSVEGAVNYSVQLKQPGLPMYKGWEYELSFDAYADSERDIIVDVEGPDKGWTRYLQDTRVSLSTEKENYTLTFTMNENSDPNGCLEFNLGALGSKASVTLSNIRLTHKSGEEIGYIKTVRPDGNYVYNGSFDQGEKRLGYWEFSEEDAQYFSSVNAGGKRELKVTVPEGKTVTLSQTDLAAMVKGQYALSFDARCEEGNGEITVNAAGESFKADVTAETSKVSKSFVLAESKDRSGSFVTFTFEKAGVYYIDNVFLGEAALIKNGSFDAGLAGFSPYVYDTVKASYRVDEAEDNAFVISIEDTMADDAGNSWYVQLNQDGVTLEQGKSYRLSFKAKSSIDRVISYCMQEFEGSWANYSNTGSVQIGNEYKTFTSEFTMNHPTDKKTRFNITMGSVDGIRITEKHEVYIDDIILEEISGTETPDEPTDPQPGDPEDPQPEEPQPEEPQPEIPEEPVEPQEPEIGGATLVTKWGKTYYVLEDGTKLKGRYEIENKYYFFSYKDGAMVKSDFITFDNGDKMYALKNGVLASNMIVTRWGTDYIFDHTGFMQTGFTSLGNDFYYCNEKGAVLKSTWIDDGEDRYYAKSDGTLARNETITKWFKKYSFDSECKLIK